MSARLMEACEAVLLFHGGGPWDDERRRKWERLMGHDDCTTKALCDFVRSAVWAAKANPPPQYVPLEKYQQLELVLRDALEEKGDVYKRRCERALELLRPWDIAPVNEAIAILEGDERSAANTRRAYPETFRREYLGQWPDRPRTEAERGWRLSITNRTDDEGEG